MKPADIESDLIQLGLSKEILGCLSGAITAARLLHFEPGDVIYHEATEVDALYIVRTGRLKLINYLENGRARIVRLHNRGSILGLNGVLEEDNAHTAIAIDNLSLYHIPMRLIKLVKHDDPDAYCNLLEYFHEYLDVADTWITEFSTGGIRGRVARLVLYLMENDDESPSEEVVLLTVEEMAEILGVTAESVSRTMADFKRKDLLIPIENGNLDKFKCDVERLAKEAEK